MVASAPPEPLAVYIHWPFCRSKCPYCDFNSHVRDSIDEARFGRALLAELEQWGTLTAGRPLVSIFFGGGTPSLMPPDLVADVIARARRLWPAPADLEVTLEANPTTVEADRFAAFADAGVNRVSLGVQSLDDRALQFLGRQHGAAEALAAVTLARRHFPRFSFDLIYARPGQTSAAWSAELLAALNHVGDHLSLYTLTIEEGTAFATQVRRSAFTPADEETVAELYDVTQDILDQAGLPAYEISNHARPGAESRHNLVYWRYGDYLGIGAGAHGRVVVDGERRAWRNWRKPESWLEAVERSSNGIESRETITAKDAAREALLMGLRLAEGIEATRFHRATGVSLADAVDQQAVAQLVASGHLITGTDRLKATIEGRAVLDAVLGRIAR